MRCLFALSAATVVALTATPALAQSTFDVKAVKRADGNVDLVATNAGGGHATVDLEVSGTNVGTLRLQSCSVVAPGRQAILATLGPRDRHQAWHYEFHYHSRLGDSTGRARDVVYALPFASGTAYKLTQGYFGSFSHQKVRALDFTMPQGTQVLAARDGVVVETETRYTEGGAQEAYKGRENHIAVEQDDGTVARYLHLEAGGVLVSVGQRVRRGQVIGLSGNTGFSSAPHLHFEVDQPENGHSQRSLATRFNLAGARQGAYLTAGRTYQAP